MNRSRYDAPTGPSVEWDGKKFSSVICFVGSDTVFSRSAIEVLRKNGILIGAIVGESADLVCKNFVADPLNKIKIISLRRPWLDAEFDLLAYSGDMLGVNCGFDFIIPNQIIHKLPILNLHPSALPLNRGCHHSFWGIMSATALGATLHWMTERLDEGPIIAQKLFMDDQFASARTIQEISSQKCLELLDENISLVMGGHSRSVPQGAGTYHSKGDIVERSTLMIGDSISVHELLNLCRATFNKGNGFYVRTGCRRFRIVIGAIDEV